MIACPLGKLSPFAAFSKGDKGRFRWNNCFNNNISTKLLIAIVVTRMENHVCFFTSKK